MISVQNVSKAFGPKKLFEDVDVAFAPGNRYGLTGPNGAGKTTFMKILAGDEEPDTGDVHRPRKLGILRQDHFRYEDNRVLDVVLMGNGPPCSRASSPRRTGTRPRPTRPSCSWGSGSRSPGTTSRCGRWRAATSC